MVLDTFGIRLDEARLRTLTDCSPLGTDAFQLVEAARYLGLATSRKYTLESVEELASLVEDGGSPIVYIDMWPLQGGSSGQHHALVVIAVNQDNVTVLDPLTGEREIPRQAFLAAWAAMRFLTIVISNETP